MKKNIISIFLILLISTLTLLAQEDVANKVDYTFTLNSDCLDEPVVIASGSVMEGETFTLPSFGFPEYIPNWQQLYDALVGTTFELESGAINENVHLDIQLQQLDCDGAGFVDPTGEGNPFFIFLGIKVTGEQSGETALEDFYYFNEGKHATICFPMTEEFLAFLASVGIDPNDISFAYFLGGEYLTEGMTWEVVEGNPGKLCLYLSHFSQIAGGSGKLVGLNNGDASVPEHYFLQQNYPNPFNPSTVIKFGLPEAGNVKLDIFNLLGQNVAELVNRKLSAGIHEVTFDASNLPSGIYLYKITTGKFSETKKMILMK